MFFLDYGHHYTVFESTGAVRTLPSCYRSIPPLGIPVTFKGVDEDRTTVSGSSLQEVIGDTPVAFVLSKLFHSCFLFNINTIVTLLLYRFTTINSFSL